MATRKPRKRATRPSKGFFNIETRTQPVDPEMFLWCQGVYAVAAHLSMPVENPGARPILEHDGKQYGFSDIPMNRGMLAATKELRERGVSDDQKMATMMRLMHFGEVFDHRERLAVFIKPGDEQGTVSVSEALIKACATARFIRSGDKMHLDIEDVARIAQQLTDAEDAAEKAAKGAE